MSFFSRFNKRAQPKSALIADAEKGAAWIAKALASSGYRADFTLDSLRDVDRFFDEHTQDGTARPGGLLAQQLGYRLFAMGAYCGEVVRRLAGGHWSDTGSGPQAEIDLALELPDGRVIHPVQRVMKRYQSGSDDSLYAYGAVLVRKTDDSVNS